MLLRQGVYAQAQPDKPPSATAPPRGDRALIVVGLPGDDEHAASFRELAHTYREWLTGPLGFPEAGLRVLFGAAGEPGEEGGGATREAIAQEAAPDSSGPGSRWQVVGDHPGARKRARRACVPAPARARPAGGRAGETVCGGHLPRTSLLDHDVSFRRVPANSFRQGTHRDHGDDTRPGIQRDRVSVRARASCAGKPSRTSTRTQTERSPSGTLFSRSASSSTPVSLPTNARRPSTPCSMTTAIRPAPSGPNPARHDAQPEKARKPRITDGDLAKKTILPLKIR